MSSPEYFCCRSQIGFSAVIGMPRVWSSVHEVGKLISLSVNAWLLWSLQFRLMQPPAPGKTTVKAVRASHVGNGAAL